MSNVKIKRFVIPAIVVLVGLCVILIYYHIDPVNSRWAQLIPKCLLKTITGYDCPSCGIQRALHALLNGNFREAFWVNPFLTLCLPYIIALLYTTLSNDKFALKLKYYVQHLITTYSYLALYFIWWVVRNTEWWLSFAERWQ